MSNFENKFEKRKIYQRNWIRRKRKERRTKQLTARLLELDVFDETEEPEERQSVSTTLTEVGPSQKSKGEILEIEKAPTLSNILEEIKEVRSILDRLNSENPDSNKDLDELGFLRKPLNSLQVLEIKLESKSFQKVLINFLARLGGSSVKDIVKRMMKVVGTNKMWSDYSYNGRKGKVAFCETLSNKAILKASLRSCKTSDLKSVEKEIGDFLKHAPRREGGELYKGKSANSLLDVSRTQSDSK